MSSTRHGRIEDTRFVTGSGRFVADLAPADCLVAKIVRAPIARGVMRQLDVGPARTAPGVIAVLTAAEAQADGLVHLPWEGDPKREDGGPTRETPRPVLNDREIRHLGEPVAVIVAVSHSAAEDAVELLEMDFDQDSAATLDFAVGEGAPVWNGAPDNIAAHYRVGDPDATQAAFAGAAHITRFAIDISRVTACSMEPRVSLGSVDADGRLTLTTSTQSPFVVRGGLAATFGIEPKSMRVVAPDVGGSFGMKGALFREDVLVLWAARRLNRPVLWISTRSEAFVADDDGRAVKGSAELALDTEGNFTGLRVKIDIDAGAYFSRRSTGVLNNLGGVAGVYRTPAISAEVRSHYTNTVPVTPYRGFGRPEATYIIERLIDQAARETGRDAIQLRGMNLIPPESMPFKTGLTFHYDCGNFPKVTARAKGLANIDHFPARRAASEAMGQLRGIGMSNPIEVAGGPLVQLRKDVARITVRPDGHVEVSPGCMSVGQGHETTLGAHVAGKLGLDPSVIVFKQGDTDILPSGRGNGGSSSTAVGGAAVATAIKTLIEAGRKLAADELEAAATDIEFSGGTYRVVGTDKQLSITDVAKIADPVDGLSILDEFLPAAPTYPNGCHICEVEIDPETGAVNVVAYTGVEDVGIVLNRQIVEGQLQGGIAQGIGQALGELIIFDASGQLLSGSFLDYRMPIAADLPQFRLDLVEVPTTINPLGAKGVGEAGTVGALAATMNAIADALSTRGVTYFEMPASADRVWSALQSNRR